MASNQSVVCLQIRHQLKQNKIYSFNFSDPALNQRMPFSLIGSDTKIPSNDGASFRGRKYPWGVVNIENEVRTDLITKIVIAGARTDKGSFTHSGTLRFPDSLQGTLHSWTGGTEAANSLFCLRTLQSQEIIISGRYRRGGTFLLVFKFN